MQKGKSNLFSRSFYGCALAIMFFSTGCGAIAAGIQNNKSMMYHAGNSAFARKEQPPANGRSAYNLLVRSEEFPPYMLLGQDNIFYYPVGIINWLIPLPSVRMVNFISAHLKDLTDEDIENIATALRERLKIKRNSQQVVGGEFYFWSEKYQLSVSMTKARYQYQGPQTYWMAVEGVHGKGIFDLAIKELKLKLSDESKATYEKTLLPFTPDVSPGNALTFKDVFGN